MWLKVVSL